MWIELVLSQKIEIGLEIVMPILDNVWAIQSNWVKHEVLAIYSTLEIEGETDSFFLLWEATKQSQRKNETPLVIFLSSKLLLYGA